MITNILFDLDGTLSDPRLGIVRSTLYALERMGRDLPEERSLDWIIGPPIQNSLGTILGTDDKNEINRCLSFFRERFKDIGLYENELYDGIPEVLSELTSHGYRLLIATSKPKVFADQIVQHFEIARYFHQVYGSGLDGTRTHKAEVIEDLLRGESISPESAIMVGDREHDVIGARAHGIDCIGVLYGYGSREELEAAGAIALIQSPRDLPSVLAS